MPKIKTHRGAAKRFKKTATGKIKRAKANRSHLLGHKTAKKKRNLRKAGYLSSSEQKRVEKLLSDS